MLAEAQLAYFGRLLQGFRYKGTTKGERAYGFFVEKALSSLLPSTPELPFAVRVDMDILSDNGAAADTAFNSAALALQNAKLPLAVPVAGEACIEKSESSDDEDFSASPAGCTGCKSSYNLRLCSQTLP